jgi:hypothetical protein
MARLDRGGSAKVVSRESADNQERSVRWPPAAERCLAPSDTAEMKMVGRRDTATNLIATRADLYKPAASERLAT